MLKPDLKIVPAAPVPYNERKGLKRIEMLRTQLVRAAIRYIQEGQEGTVGDRTRAASDLSGIPRARLELEAKT